MRVDNQTALPQKPNAARGRRPAQSARRPAGPANGQPAQNARRGQKAAAQRPQQRSAAKRPNVAPNPQKGALSKTAQNKRNAIADRANTQAAQSKKKSFQAYQAKLTDIIKKRDQNSDMKLSLAETGSTKADFNKIDLNKDGFINKAEIEARISSRIDAMEEVLLTDPGKLVKMMKELGPEISDKVGGKDSYKKIVKNLKILQANDNVKNPDKPKAKGNVSFMA